MQRAIKLRGHSGAVCKLCFLKSLKLASADKNGELIIWDFGQNKVIKRFEKLNSQITAIIPIFNENYILASTTLGKIALYDIKKMELLSTMYHNVDGVIIGMEYVKEKDILIIAKENGEIELFNLASSNKLLETLIDEGDYYNAHRLIDSDLLLQNSKQSDRLNIMWQICVKEAEEILSQGNLEKAKDILRPFMNVISKKLFIQNLFKNFNLIKQFETAVKNKKYPVAYSLANANPNFKEGAIYKLLEDDWNKTFNAVKLSIFKPNFEEIAKKALLPFRAVPEKALFIQMLINEKNSYGEFLKAMAKKEFKKVLELSIRYPFLKNTDEYQKIDKFMNKLLENSRNNLDSGKYQEALKEAKYLLENGFFIEEAEDLSTKAQVYLRFDKEFEARNYQMIYKLVDKYQFLQERIEFVIVEERWMEAVYKAEKSALKPDIPTIKVIFEDFEEIKSKLPKMVTIIKSAYLKELELAIKSRNITNMKLESAIKKFIELFGYSDVIHILDMYSAVRGVEITFENVIEGDMYNISNLEFLPDSILV